MFTGDILRPVIVWENYPRVGLRVETGESQFALGKNLFSTARNGGTKVQGQTQRINSQWWDKKLYGKRYHHWQTIASYKRNDYQLTMVRKKVVKQKVFNINSWM